jgi:hypothetical protein
MEVVEAQTRVCQPVNIWCIDRRAITAEVAVPHIVQYDHNDIRRAFRRPGRRVPGRFRFGHRKAELPFEFFSLPSNCSPPLENRLFD